MTKICSCCNTEKPLTEYSKHTGTKDGLEYECKLCHNLRTRRNRQERKYAVLTQPTSEWMACLRKEDVVLYYELYRTRGSFRAHIETNFPKLFIKIYL